MKLVALFLSIIWLTFLRWGAIYRTVPIQLEHLVSEMVLRHESDGDLWLLSLLNQRLCLDLVEYRPDVVEFQQMSVEKYLSYLAPNSESLSIHYTVEPFLSHFIAVAMWPRIQPALSVVKNRLYAGMLNKDTAGRFVMRLIMTLAKDACAQDLNPKADELRYLGSVSLLTFLLKMFGPNFFDKGSCDVPEDLKALLSGRMVNFVQWIRRATRWWVVLFSRLDFDF